MDMYAICGKLSVICAMYDMWAGRQYVMGRKAICCVMDRKVGVGRTGRFTQQGRKSPETHGPEGRAGRQCYVDRMVRAGRRMCVSCILGNSLSIYAYSCYVCVSGTSEDRGNAPA